MLRRVDESAGGTTFKRWYPLTDAQFSVRAVLRDDAGVHERINYSPYGVAEHHWGGDVDGDGSGDFFDILALGDQVGLGDVDIGEANYVAEMDLNRDGTLDGDDVNAMVTGTALPSGWISAAGAGNPGNVIGFDGYVFNPEIETYSVRFRWYDPELGRWLQRDPAGYRDGSNLFEYVKGNAVRNLDPLGLGFWDGVWSGVVDLGNGACRVGKGIYYGSVGVFDREAEMQAAEIARYNEAALRFVQNVVENARLIEQAVEAILESSLADVPECAKEGFLADVLQTIGTHGAGRLAGNAAMNVLLRAAVRDLEQEALAGFVKRVGLKPSKGGGVGVGCVIAAYQVYGIVEKAQNASESLHAWNSSLWHKLNGLGDLDLLPMFLEATMDFLETADDLGADELIDKYCCGGE